MGLLKGKSGPASIGTSFSTGFLTNPVMVGLVLMVLVPRVDGGAPLILTQSGAYWEFMAHETITTASYVVLVMEGGALFHVSLNAGTCHLAIGDSLSVKLG